MSDRSHQVETIAIKQGLSTFSLNPVNIDGLLVIVSLFFCGALVFLGYSMINGIYNARYTTPRASAEIGYDILHFYYEKSSRGEISVETAKETALEILKSVRYEGGKGIFLGK